METDSPQNHYMFVDHRTVVLTLECRMRGRLDFLRYADAKFYNKIRGTVSSTANIHCIFVHLLQMSVYWIF